MSCCNSNCNHDPCGSSFNQKLTMAAQYAQYAQTQANKAESLWEEFNALYLGAFAVAPTQDNQGNPLQVGALYWNTGASELYAWNGLAWETSAGFNEFTPFLSTGSTTPRNLATRMADVVNVKDFGAVGDGIADDTEKIQAAINSNIGRAIYFPSGVYSINDTLNINNSHIILFCDTHESARIQLKNLSCAAAIKIQSNIAGQEIFKPGIENLVISRIEGSTYAIAVDVERARSFRMNSVEIYGFPTALNIKGGAIGYYSNCAISSYGSTNTDPKTGVLQISEATLGSAFGGYTHLFDNCHITGGRYPVKIIGGDHVSFSNCYIGRPGGTGSIVNAEGGVLIEPDSTQTIGSYNNNFDNCYFDRAALTAGDLYAVTINDLTTPPPENAVATKFTDCVFTGWEKHIYINKSYDPTIEITGCRFDGAYGEAIDATGNYTNLVITGNQFYKNTLGLPGRSTLDIKDAYSVAITGNIFSLIYVSPTSYPGTRDMIRLGGTITALTITGNAINNGSGKTITDFVNTATINKLAISGNASNNPNNTIVGHLIGNQANSNSLMLDWYQEQTFTPSLAFGGSSTGITYVQQNGSLTRIGDRVFFDLYFQLSSKGSATGNASISGLPYNYDVNSIACFTIQGGGFNPAIGDANLDAQRVIPNLIQPNKQVSGSTLAMTDADFQNNTFLTITGTYRVQQ